MAAMGEMSGTRRRLHRLLGGLAGLAMSMPIVPPAGAQADGVPGFYRVLWRSNEGAPIEVRGVVPTQDGFLWVGSYTGLYRFDGVRFERFEPPWGQALPSNAITAMASEPPSGVWVAASGGHIAKVAENRLVEHFELPEQAGHISKLVIRGTQRYAITSGGLYEGGGKHWRHVAVREGNTPLRLYDGILLPNGALWLSSTEGFFVRQAGGTYFRHVEADPAGAGKFSAIGNQALWYCGEVGGLRRFDLKSGTVEANTEFPCHQFFFDHQAKAWVATPSGFGRIDPEMALKDAVAARAVLAQDAFGESTIARSMAQSSDGSVWIGTNNGLSQFHPYRLGQPAFPGGYGGLAAASDGGLWVISHSRGLIKVGANAGPRPAAGDRLTHIMRDARGIVWIGGQRRAELIRVEDEAISRVPFTPGGAEVFVVGMAGAADGTLWVATAPAPEGNVYRLINGVWHAGAGFKSLDGRPVTGVWADARGRIWLGFTDSRMAMVDGGRLIEYPQTQDLHLGAIRKFADYQGAVLVGGDEGLALALGKQLTPVQLQAPMRVLGPTGILAARNGDVWVNQAANLLRIPSGQMRRLVRDPSVVIGAEVFDYRDGRLGAPVVAAPHPTVAEQADGTLWFATANLTTFHPSALRHPRPIHHVALTKVTAGREPVGFDAGSFQIPAVAEEVSIAYAVSDLLTSDRLQIRFKLDGVDSEWRGAGKDRTVTYKRPVPGTYTFRIATSNDLGLWNDEQVKAQIQVLPQFHETTWFKLLIAGFVIALCGLLIWARSTWLTMRIRDKLRERAKERERIARELHDTLLQGIQGLMLHVHTVANDLPEQGQSRQLMNRALDRADALMAEGRQRVSDLRLQEEGAPIGTSLERYLIESGLHDQTCIRVRQTGHPREIQPSVRLEILRIGAEAAANSVQHSGCKRIRIVVRYDRDALRVRVRDDGCGLDCMLAAKGRPGHFGIRGMYERAVSIRAKFRLYRSKAGGTTMDLIVPAAIAYGDRRSRWVRRILSARPKPSSTS